MIMKGKYKCYGLLLILSVIFGLSFVESSKVSALKYSIDVISIAPGNINTFRKLNNEFVYFTYNKEFAVKLTSVPSGFTFPHLWNFSGVYDSTTNTCTIPFGDSSFYSDGVSMNSDSSGVVTYTSSIPGYNKFDSSITSSLTSPINWSSPFVINSGDFLDVDFNNPLCNIYRFVYNDMTVDNPANFSYAPRWDFSSLINIPLVNNRLAYENSKPYFYSYDGILINGSKYENGILSNKYGITTSDLFDANSASAIRELSLSLPLFQESTNSIDDESEHAEDVYNFDITGSFEFDQVYTINSDFSVHMLISNFYDPYFAPSENQPNSISINNQTIYNLGAYDGLIDKLCTYTDYHTNNGDDFNRIDFVCSYNPSSDGGYSPEIDFRFLDTRIVFANDYYYDNPDVASMFTTNGDFKIVDFNIVTNNNSTSAGWSATGYIEGGDTTLAPGNEGQDDLYNPDFTSSLVNMFNFSFTNPFSPLFNLFTSGNSCVNIPTIAGMLGSTETQYCSWFDSTTRSVLTPVLGLSSMMLIFGFAVRWLGSSSGNMFEDQTTHKWSNTQFKQKGGK